MSPIILGIQLNLDVYGWFNFHIFISDLNPTSPLGDRWSRAFVSILRSIIQSTLPPTLHPINSTNSTSNQLYQLYLLPTSLEEWFTPPPSSSPGSKIVRPRSPVGACTRLFRYPGRHHFFIIFQHVFSSILPPSWLPKWLPNHPKFNQKSI